MARLTDPIILQCYLNAFANWRFTNYIRFTRLADEWLRSEIGNYTQKAFAEMLSIFSARVERSTRSSRGVRNGPCMNIIMTSVRSSMAVGSTLKHDCSIPTPTIAMTRES